MFETQRSSEEVLPEKKKGKFWETFRSLRHRNYRLFWFGQMISLIGTWMQNVAQGWLVLRLSNSPFLLGAVSAFAGLPILFFSLPAGVLADRVNKRKFLIFTQIGAMLLAFILAFLAFTGLVKVWHVMFLALCLGLVMAFDAPARQAFIKEMVGKDDLLNAIALNSAIFNGARILGPAVAGILISLTGEAGCFFINGLSYLAVIAGLYMMKMQDIVFQSRNSSFLISFKQGISYIIGNKKVLALILMASTMSIFGLSYAVLMPVFARDILKAGSSGLGFLMSAAGIGAISAGLGLASRKKEEKLKYMQAGITVFFISLLLFSFSKSFFFSFIFLIGAGWGMISLVATCNTLLQEIIPDELRGRVMSFYVMMFMGTMPLGSLIAGTLGEAVGVIWAVRVGALLCGGISLFLFKKFIEKEIIRTSG
ncbi:MAG: MFS transporter [candidate division Zixibacteria bacterium]|nr:MFS transporter [candidate division Zixibacteria bacterium]